MDGSGLFVAVQVHIGQAFQIAVEHYADQFTGTIHGGAAEIAAADVAGADEIQGDGRA